MSHKSALTVLRCIRERDARISSSGPRYRGCTMSDEFDNLDANEKAALESTLYRCRTLAGRIGEELRKKKPEHFVDERSLADFHAYSEGPAGGRPSASPLGRGNSLTRRSQQVMRLLCGYAMATYFYERPPSRSH